MNETVVKARRYISNDTNKLIVGADALHRPVANVTGHDKYSWVHGSMKGIDPYEGVYLSRFVYAQNFVSIRVQISGMSRTSSPTIK